MQRQNILIKLVPVFALSMTGLIPNQAQAETSSLATVVQAANRVSQKPATYAKNYIEKFFKNDARYNAVDIKKIVAPKEYEAAQKDINEAKELYNKGREAFDNLELDESISYLQKSITLLEKNASFLESFKTISESYLALGAAYIVGSKLDMGSAAIVKGIFIYPSIVPDANVYNQQMMKIFNEAQEICKNASKGTADISTQPLFSEVLIDGTFIGVTPLTTDAIPSGHHIIQLRQDGYITDSKVVDLNMTHAINFDATLVTTSETTRYKDLAAKAVGQISKENCPDSIRKLATYLKVENIIVGSIKYDAEKLDLTVAQYNNISGEKVKSANTSFEWNDETMEKIIHRFLYANFSAEYLANEPIENNEQYCIFNTCGNGNACTTNEECQIKEEIPEDNPADKKKAKKQKKKEKTK